MQRQVRPGGPINISITLTGNDIVPGLVPLLNDDPADVEVAVAAAKLYRDYPQESAGNSEAAALAADEIMRDLVNSSPTNPDALIARSKYRYLYGDKQGAREDLETVLTHKPDHVEALLLLAADEASRGGAENLQAA